MDEKIIAAAQAAVAEAVSSGQRVEVVPLKDDVKVNRIERKEIKLHP